MIQVAAVFPKKIHDEDGRWLREVQLLEEFPHAGGINCAVEVVQIIDPLTGAVKDLGIRFDNCYCYHKHSLAKVSRGFGVEKIMVVSGCNKYVGLNVRKRSELCQLSH